MFKEFGLTANISKAVGKHASKLGLRPTQITWISLLPAIGGLVLAAYHYTILAVVFFLISGFFDMLDGAVARHTGMTSHLGAFIDGTLDRFVDMMIVIAIYFQTLPMIGLKTDLWLILLAFFMIMPSFIVAYANHRKAVKDPNETVVWRILHRMEMFVLFFAILILGQYAPLAGTIVLLVTLFLCVLTTIQSFWLAIKRAYTHPY